MRRRATEHDVVLAAARAAHSLAALLNCLQHAGHSTRDRNALRARLRKLSGLVRVHGGTWQPSAVGVVSLVGEVFPDASADIVYDPELENSV